jgi:hypothetical protein
LCTCTAPSGAKKAHDWAVDQLADLFRTTHRVKTQQVVKSRGQHYEDIELAGYLANEAGPVPLVLDLRIANDRFGSSYDPTLNGRLHYNDIDKSLNEAATERSVNIARTIIIIHLTLSLLCRLLLVRLDDYIVNLSDFYSYRLIGKLTAFLQLQEFSQRNQTWGLRTSTFAARRSQISLSQNADCYSQRLLLYVLILI